MIKNEASVGEVREFESAEAHELEGVEIGLALAESCEKRLELLEMIYVIASFKNC